MGAGGIVKERGCNALNGWMARLDSVEMNGLTGISGIKTSWTWLKLLVHEVDLERVEVGLEEGEDGYEAWADESCSFALVSLFDCTLALPVGRKDARVCGVGVSGPEMRHAIASRGSYWTGGEGMRALDRAAIQLAAAAESPSVFCRAAALAMSGELSGEREPANAPLSELAILRIRVSPGVRRKHKRRCYRSRVSRPSRSADCQKEQSQLCLGMQAS